MEESLGKFLHIHIGISERFPRVKKSSRKFNSYVQVIFERIFREISR